jgi:hypothetical protein
MATEAPPPSPTPEEISGTDSPSLNTGEAPIASPVSLDKPTGQHGARRNDDERCDRCGLWFTKGVIVTNPDGLVNLCPDCTQAFNTLAASPIIDSNAPPVRLTELFCVALVDKTTGDEGLMAMGIGSGDILIPLVTESRDKLRILVQMARTAADNVGFQYRVYRLSSLEDITDTAMSDSAQPKQP